MAERHGAAVIVLLRGINIGARNRIAMGALREALSAAGLRGVRTHLQSGSVLCAGVESPEEIVARVRAMISTSFGLQIDAVARSAGELAAVVAANPLGHVALDPRRYQVAFLTQASSETVLERLHAAAIEPERLIGIGRELYAWHPDGVARSKLWNALAGDLGVSATARNWSTVCALEELARG
jgi:uncharacterized protein (DUF1697 family)